MSLLEGMLFAKDALWDVFMQFCFISILEVCDFINLGIYCCLRGLGVASVGSGFGLVGV